MVDKNSGLYATASELSRHSDLSVALGGGGERGREGGRQAGKMQAGRDGGGEGGREEGSSN